ncbi:MAG: hypothetical protein FRX49_00895 [Trebouxia sp. A1-2]|nr:MAG: hypothetical protein FRX49_00895 [Trebouxia sp. A1-2]
MPRINITELCIATGSSVAEAKKIHQERSSELLYLKRRDLLQNTLLVPDDEEDDDQLNADGRRVLVTAVQQLLTMPQRLV